ncbi:MAG: glycosyltransferase [Minisyncoccia bacterium]
MENLKIKVTIVINDFLVGGAQKLVADQLNFFDRDRFDVSLITLCDYPGSPTLYHLLPEHVRVVKLRFRNYFRDIQSWFKLWRELRRSRPDVVVSHLFFSNTVCRVLKPLGGYASIAVEHSTYIDKKYMRVLIDRILARVTFKIVAVSQMVADFTAKQEHIPPKKFVVIPNGVDIEKMQAALAALPSKEALKRELGFPSSDKILLTVGRLDPVKNHRLLLEGFARFHTKHPEYKLAIVGESHLQAELEAHARKLELGDAAVFFGLRLDVERFYKASDAFVLTSDREGFSIVGIEAMAAGLPLVSTKVAGPDEYLKEGKNGFFIQARSPEALAESLEKMVNSDLEQMEKNSRKTAAEFDIRMSVGKYEKLIDTLS